MFFSLIFEKRLGRHQEVRSRRQNFAGRIGWNARQRRNDEVKTWRAKKQEIHEKLGSERSEVLEITAQLINLIHKRRLELGLTQEQLAARIIERGGNLRQEHIARIETGAVVPRIDTLVTIARALDLDLFNLKGTEEAASKTYA
ncbi:helix-turn-helix domain-containing protein [Paenibacillus sonchi]|nr:helix-turn-helix transcriptional regulator [Paenibacillus sonchi]MCE3199090.1 helix-turn-helix domain-containing protein [Paenibacillus sonchi]